MRDIFDLFLFVLDQFLRPAQNVYGFLSKHLTHNDYMFSGLAIMGLFLIAVGLMNFFLKRSSPI